tara:strand:- start:250 stop:570 length:321 start_codon:yes stop_codon:yes gene_type:complete
MTRREIRLERILNDVCNYYGIKLSDIKGRSRLRKFVEARHMFCYLAREHTYSSLSEIGLTVNRDHSNVIHSIKKVNSLKDIYKSINKEISEISSDESLYDKGGVSV